MFKRPIFQKILSRLQEPRNLIQVLAGPRQVGKTTIAKQLSAELNCPVRYASADDADLRGASWIEQQWEIMRLQQKGTEWQRDNLRAKDASDEISPLLILDEIQKISQWSETIKKLLRISMGFINSYGKIHFKYNVPKL